jgi:4-amino-4-deoxy-L-arabinose transferase-like glycosyltransferase
VSTSTARIPAAHVGGERGLARSRASVAWALGAIVAVGAVARFATLDVQSYHHDEVITAARVVAGSFGHMLHEVRASESNPPLYYLLAWAWAKLFGTGEVGLRSLSALCGAATVPVAYLIGRELADRRAGLLTAALVAVNPMLIWYSQEARSYAPLVLFGALSFLFFARARRTGAGADLGLWALFSSLALWSHYFAFFPVAIEAAWLLAALLPRARVLLAAGAVGLAGLALLPLLTAQVNPAHIGWIDEASLPSRLWETGVSFLAGETGHVIAEPPRERYALLPALVVGAALVLLAAFGSRRERRGGAVGLVVGLGVAGLAALAAVFGHDYVVERNLLPALVPLAAVVGIGLGAERARSAGLLLALALCAYWLAFAAYVAGTPNLQRPDFREFAQRIGAPRQQRAIVTWKLAADPLVFYLADGAQRLYAGSQSVREVDVLSKRLAGGERVPLPPSFHLRERIRLDRLTILRFVSRPSQQLWFHALRDLPTGFGRNAVLVDGLPSQRGLPPHAGVYRGAEGRLHHAPGLADRVVAPPERRRGLR